MKVSDIFLKYLPANQRTRDEAIIVLTASLVAPFSNSFLAASLTKRKHVKVQHLKTVVLENFLLSLSRRSPPPLLVS